MAELVKSIVVEPIVSYIIERAASLIKEEFHAIHGVKQEVKKLSSNLQSIRAVLKDAEQRQLNAAGDESLRVWLAKLKDVAYDAQDILDTVETETFHLNRKQKVSKILRKPYISNTIAHKIKQISAKLNEIDQEKNRFHLKASADSGRSQNHELPQTTFFVDTADVFGRESDRDRLIDKMISNKSDAKDDISVIPIIGMGGLGKTTLVQLIFNDERVKNHFEFRMWVCVRVDFNFRRILKEMTEFHTEMSYPNDLPINTLVSRFLEFMRGKNFLLVLDDVWTHNYQEWAPLQSLLKQGDKGSRVLVTTRSDTVSNIMGTQPPYRLEYLPEDECWSLFRKIAFKDSNSLGDTLQKELEEIGIEIVGKCKGLPLTVKAMGGLLRGNVDVNKWKQILRDSI